MQLRVTLGVTFEGLKSKYSPDGEAVDKHFQQSYVIKMSEKGTVINTLLENMTGVIQQKRKTLSREIKLWFSNNREEFFS